METVRHSWKMPAFTGDRKTCVGTSAAGRRHACQVIALLCCLVAAPAGVAAEPQHVGHVSPGAARHDPANSPKNKWTTSGIRKAAQDGETLGPAPRILPDVGPELVPPMARSRRLPDPNAVDPNAVDPNAVDPNAVDPNAVDPHAADLATAPNRGIDLIRQAYAESLRSQTADQYSQVIAACREGIAHGVTLETKKYAERLMAWALNRRGESLARDGHEREALADFNAAIRLDKTRWRALHNRGVSYAMEGKTADAIADFDRAIQLNPNYANAYFNRGEMEYETGQFEEAIRDYTEAIRLAPEDSAAWNSRGHAYFQVGKHREAVRDFTEAVRMDPKNAAALTNRGDLFSKLGYYAEALRDYRRAIEIDPDLGRTHQSVAWLIATCPDEELHDANLALTAAQRAIELDGEDDPKYLDTLAAAHADAGQFDVASQIVTKAIRLVPQRDSKPYRTRLALYQQRKPYRLSSTRPRPAPPAARVDREVRPTSATSVPRPRRRLPGSGS
ncbi:MAG: tetratricopeptide repeat protein [Pirellulales bacterium]